MNIHIFIYEYMNIEYMSPKMTLVVTAQISGLLQAIHCSKDSTDMESFTTGEL